MNLIEIADECVLKMKQKYCGNDTEGPKRIYKDTAYIAIFEDNQTRYSTKRSILASATQCILIHSYIKKIRNAYDGYEIEFINKDGQVFFNRLDENYKLFVGWHDNWSNLRLRLTDNNLLCFCEFSLNSIPVFVGIEKMWHLYTRLKDAKTTEERMLISHMYQQDEKILQQEETIEGFKFTNALLEKERDMYKSLLDDIKKLLPGENK